MVNKLNHDATTTKARCLRTEGLYENILFKWNQVTHEDLAVASSKTSARSNAGLLSTNHDTSNQSARKREHFTMCRTPTYNYSVTKSAWLRSQRYYTCWWIQITKKLLPIDQTKSLSHARENPLAVAKTVFLSHNIPTYEQFQSVHQWPDKNAQLVVQAESADLSIIHAKLGKHWIVARPTKLAAYKTMKNQFEKRTQRCFKSENINHSKANKCLRCGLTL